MLTRMDSMLGAMGGGPDGLGAARRRVGGPGPQVPITRYHTAPLGAELSMLEPADTSSGAAMQSAGFTLLFVAVGTGVGVALGGGWGAVGGMMLTGAAANGYRAQKWSNAADPGQRHEAIVSGIFALFGAVGGSYALYQAASKKKG